MRKGGDSSIPACEKSRFFLAKTNLLFSLAGIMNNVELQY